MASSGFLSAILGAAVMAAAVSGMAEEIRFATYDAGLSRDGAGVLLRDLGREPDAALAGAIAVIQEVRPDVLLLTRFDHDLTGRAIAAFAALLRNGENGLDYPHSFNAAVNAGEPSGLDIDDDGMLMGWNDAWGWGKYPGHGGMALLSRYPIDAEQVRTFQHLLWSDLPGAKQPSTAEGTPWPSAEVSVALRLSSRSHWDVPVKTGEGITIHVLAANPTPPLFDGPERFNQLRNHDELLFWAEYLDGTAFTDDQGRKAAAPAAPVVLMGDFNIDPVDGAGLADGILALLSHDRLQDVRPQSPGGRLAANPEHDSPPELDTADWKDLNGPGNLRVDYVLPDAGLQVTGSGVFWPAPDETLAAEALAASAHRLVWVDVEIPGAKTSASLR